MAPQASQKVFKDLIENFMRVFVNHQESSQVQCLQALTLLDD